jgi:hypothetical protein
MVPNSNIFREQMKEIRDCRKEFGSIVQAFNTDRPVSGYKITSWLIQVVQASYQYEMVPCTVFVDALKNTLRGAIVATSTMALEETAFAVIIRVLRSCAEPEVTVRKAIAALSCSDDLITFVQRIRELVMLARIQEAASTQPGSTSKLLEQEDASLKASYSSMKEVPVRMMSKGMEMLRQMKLSASACHDLIEHIKQALRDSEFDFLLAGVCDVALQNDPMSLALFLEDRGPLVPRKQKGVLSVPVSSLAEALGSVDAEVLQEAGALVVDALAKGKPWQSWSKRAQPAGQPHGQQQQQQQQQPTRTFSSSRYSFHRQSRPQASSVSTSKDSAPAPASLTDREREFWCKEFKHRDGHFCNCHQCLLKKHSSDVKTLTIEDGSPPGDHDSSSSDDPS